MAKKIAELFVEVLATGGAERIYGVAGDSLNGITDSVRRRNGIEWVGVRHEETAAFAAGAEAALTGKLAVCAGIVRSATKLKVCDQGPKVPNAPFVVATRQ